MTSNTVTIQPHRRTPATVTKMPAGTQPLVDVQTARAHYLIQARRFRARKLASRAENTRLRERALA